MHLAILQALNSYSSTIFNAHKPLRAFVCLCVRVSIKNGHLCCVCFFETFYEGQNKTDQTCTSD